MEERRRVARHRTLKAGHIHFNRSAAIDCQVRNLSGYGACLEVASPVGIPDEFVLEIAADHCRQPCQVIWRKAGRLGVAFGGMRA
ncbi:MAG: PilZ domain-containing protein [Pseudolabrys sp.]|nr:PilZ domain-containing protein [Pseudolabrys sp.]MBV9956510.1 PilZ domain-containing protein [Pseudolabrys sp.]